LYGYFCNPLELGCFSGNGSGVASVSGWTGSGRKGELSRFVEEAVQAHILELSVQPAKEQNVGQTPAVIQSAIEEVLRWVRQS